MKHERATEEIRELAALYALGSLTQHEARSFEIHMQEGCPVCEEEFHKFEHAVTGIGFAVEEIETPGYIRDLLLARVEREPQTAESKAAADRKSEPEAQPAPPQEKPSVVPAAKPVFSQLERKQPRIFAWILIAILAALVILAIFLWKSAKDTNIQLQARASAAEADADNLRIRLDIQKSKVDDLEQILAIVGKPGARIARLVGQAVAPSSSGAVFWDKEQRQCLIVGSFPPAPQGKAYQLWFVTPPTARVSAGFIKVETSGRAFTTISIPGNAADAAVVLVTLEPDNGSQMPTTPYYAIGRFD